MCDPFSLEAVGKKLLCGFRFHEGCNHKAGVSKCLEIPREGPMIADRLDHLSRGVVPGDEFLMWLSVPADFPVDCRFEADSLD